MEEDYREVDFHKYCDTCKHRNLDEVKDPCNECLSEPINLYTDKPTKWEEA